MRALRLVLPLAVLMTGLFVTTTTSFAKPEYMKKEKAKSCTTCHVAAGKKDLNDVGKCYAKKHSMEGCEVAKK
jgi:hypothetical protein